MASFSNSTELALGTPGYDGRTGFVPRYRTEILYVSLALPVVVELGVLLKRYGHHITRLCGRRVRRHDWLAYRDENIDDHAKRLRRRLITGVSAASLATLTTAAIALAKLGYLDWLGDWTQSSFESSVDVMDGWVQKGINLGNETPDIGVYLGHVLFAVAHSLQVARNRKSVPRIVSHSYAAVVSLAAIPIMATGRQDLRWHHFSIALAALIPDIRVLQTLAHLLLLDGLAYWVDPNRDSYDFSNIVREHLPVYSILFTLLTIWQFYIDARWAKQQVRERERGAVILEDWSEGEISLEDMEEQV